MASPSTEDVPPDVDAAVRAAVARDYPGREIGAIRSCAASPAERVVRVFLPVPRLRPSPYCVYRIEPNGVARRLEGDEAAPFAIANYK
jgi:hypothetical protein